MASIVTLRQTLSLHDEASRDTSLKQNGPGSWIGLCPIHDEKNPSFSVFTGHDGIERFTCFGCGAQGDIVDYIEATRRVDKKAAIALLSQQSEHLPPAPRLVKPQVDPYAGLKPLPLGDNIITPGQEIPVWNPKRQKVTRCTPVAAYRYDCGYVLRCEMPDGRKWTPMVQWCEGPGGKHAWCFYPFKEPRPLYGRAGEQTLVVEGEKCVDAVLSVLATLGWGCVSWAGGAQAIIKSNWKPLVGKEIWIWPDADEPGLKAAEELQERFRDARVVDVTGKPEGWDVADAVAEGWDWERIEGFLRGERGAENDSAAHKTLAGRVRKPAAVEDADPRPEPPPYDETPQSSSAVTITFPKDSPFSWISNAPFILGNRPINLGGHTVAIDPHSVTNAKLLAMNHQEVKGCVIYDVFCNEIILRECPPWEEDDTFSPRKLRDTDLLGLRVWLEKYELKVTRTDADDLLTLMGNANPKNTPKDYFDSIKWDGKSRIDNWLTYYLGVDTSEYVKFVGRKWLVAAVSRVFEPGCKFDTALILEGPQYLGKSRALERLATIGEQRYFTDEAIDFRSKDSIMRCQGRLIVELAELASWRKAETDEIKAFISRQVDSYRPPYGRKIIERPRMFVLAGTVNPNGGWLSDSTGNRRYWPVTCTAIDLDALDADREQLWAEAVVRYRAGERLWLVPEEYELAKVQQEYRFNEEALAEDIEKAMKEISLVNGMFDGVTVNAILNELKIPAERKTNQMAGRIKGYLTHHNYKEHRVEIDNERKRVWKRAENIT